MHPIQMEVNRFIAARNDSMVLVFALAGVLCKNKWHSLAFFFLALTTKEVTATDPVEQLADENFIQFIEFIY